MSRAKKSFLLVEPVAKTPYPPLGLMKISSMLKRRHKDCDVVEADGTTTPAGLRNPHTIYITSLFTWDLDEVIRSVRFYGDMFPKAKIRVGGIAASLLPDAIKAATNIEPHVGLYQAAESFPPDYALTFGRRLRASLTFASRGCPRNCPFCCVNTHEPDFYARDDWEKDISPDLPDIVFWDNNWLASPNLASDCDKLRAFDRNVDFNQGLDARLYDDVAAKALRQINITPIRFAFDSTSSEPYLRKAIKLAKKHSNSEIRVYVLYNFTDAPEDFYYRIRLLNRLGVLAFPMEFRKPTAAKTKFPGPHWDALLLRALKLSLIFYYRRGMITESRESFDSIYGKTPRQFVKKLYEIYEYDKEKARERWSAKRVSRVR